MFGDLVTSDGGIPTFLIDVRVHLIGDDPTLTFVFFLGVSLLGVLGLRFSYYADRNLRRTHLDSQRRIWQYLRYIGVLGVAYGTTWLFEITTPFGFEAKSGFWLAMTLVLGVSIRQISTTAGTALSPRQERLDRFVRLGFGALVGIYVVFVLGFGPSRFTAAIEAASAAAFLGYGGYFFRRQIARTRLQGTMLDSLLRHLMPVLTFAALASALSFAVAIGIDRWTVLHVQLVFLIMTATALMTTTIKLRQNLASL